MRSRFLDGRSDQIAPLGPAAVVIFDVLEIEQVLEHEPGVAGPLADAAVGDHRFFSGDAGTPVQLPQLLDALESPILVARFAPRDAFRSRDVAAALACFRQAWGCQDF